MNTKTVLLAASLVLSLTGAALAQTAAGGGSAEGNMNSPGSVKSNSEKSMEQKTGTATGMPADAAAVPGASGGPSTATTGSPSGSNSGNAATGSGAAPSGK